MKPFKFNDKPIQEAVHALAIENGVTDSQMAAYIYRNIYNPVEGRRLSAKIKAHSVAITNLSKLL